MTNERLCKGCNVIFSTKSNMHRHQKKCTLWLESTTIINNDVANTSINVSEEKSANSEVESDAENESETSEVDSEVETDNETDDEKSSNNIIRNVAPLRAGAQNVADSVSRRQKLDEIIANNYKILILQEYLKQNLSDSDFEKYKLLFEANITMTEKFCVDFDKLCIQVGFSQKAHGKDLLKNFTLNVDYIIYNARSGHNLLSDKPEYDRHTSSHGGHNREIIKLTLEAAQMFSLAAKTKRAKEMRHFFVNTMKHIFDYDYLDAGISKKIEIATMHENMLLQSIKPGDKIVYMAAIGNGNIKVGQTSNYLKRHCAHKSSFETYFLLHIIKTVDQVALENMLKQDELARSLRIDVYNKKNKRQIECYTDFEKIKSQLETFNKYIIEKNELKNNSEEYLKIQLDIEKEKTKQIEIQSAERTKQLEIQSAEKQLEIQSAERTLQLQFEMMKLFRPSQ